ncbi:MAG: hypothetical protein ACE5LS_06875 [Thermoplasmata archaeon]
MGSLAKPGWLVRAPRRGHATEREVQDAATWGERLGVEKHGRLLELLQSKDLDGRKEELRDWASLYGLRFFERAGLDYVYDGEQRRIEMYEYAIRRVDGFRFLGTVRSFDNKYYRKAASVGRVGFREAYHEEEFAFARKHAHRPVKVPLTGPYTLADWSFNEYYHNGRRDVPDLKQRRLEAKRDLVLDLAERVIRPNIQALERAGADLVQIDEPAAATHPEEVETFVEGFNAATEGTHAKIVAHICYSDYRRLYPAALEMKRCRQFAWEVANREDPEDGYAPLRLLREYEDDREIAVGVLDVHRNRVETPEEVRGRLLQAADILGDPGRILANPDCGLRTRTWGVAFAKLRNMVEGARMARVAYGAS